MKIEEIQESDGHHTIKRQRHCSTDDQDEDVSSTSPLDVCGRSPSPPTNSESFPLISSGLIANLLKKEIIADSVENKIQSNDMNKTKTSIDASNSIQSPGHYTAWSCTASSRESSLCGEPPCVHPPFSMNRLTLQSPLFNSELCKFELPIPHSPPDHLDIQ